MHAALNVNQFVHASRRAIFVSLISQRIGYSLNNPTHRHSKSEQLVHQAFDNLLQARQLLTKGGHLLVVDASSPTSSKTRAKTKSDPIIDSIK
jgi:hypothetical protein